MLRKKIFYFSYEGFSKLGKINNHIRETVSWMSKLGHKVHFFNPKITKPSFEKNVKVHLIPVINLSLFKWLLFDIFSFFYLAIEYFKTKPNVIYYRESSSLTPLIFSKLFSIPLIVEINGWVLAELQQINYSKWKLSYIKFIQKLNYKYADRLIPVSNGLKKLITDNYHLEEKKIIPISNGTNPDKFKPIPTDIVRNKINLPKDKKIVGFIGSCYNYHGVQHLINAAEQLMQKREDTLFVIAGDGLNRKDWIQLTLDKKIDRYFLFPGRVDFELAPYYINSYDICVAPWDLDLYGETVGSPMKIFDYLSCGKPVIASPINGIEEIKGNNNSLILIDSRDTEIFSKVLDELLSQSNLEKLSINARDHILNNFTWEITTKKILEVINQLNNVQ